MLFTCSLVELLLSQSINVTLCQRWDLRENGLFETPTLGPFNFKNPYEWPCWKRRFEQF